MQARHDWQIVEDNQKDLHMDADVFQGKAAVSGCLFRYRSELFCLSTIMHAAPQTAMHIQMLGEVQRILFRCSPSQFDLQLRQRQPAGNQELPIRANYLLAASLYGDFQAIYWPVLSKLASADRNRPRSSMEPWPWLSSFSFFALWPAACRHVKHRV